MLQPQAQPPRSATPPLLGLPNANPQALRTDSLSIASESSLSSGASSLDMRSRSASLNEVMSDEPTERKSPEPPILLSEVAPAARRDEQAQAQKSKLLPAAASTTRPSQSQTLTRQQLSNLQRATTSSEDENQHSSQTPQTRQGPTSLPRRRVKTIIVSKKAQFCSLKKRLTLHKTPKIDRPIHLCEVCPASRGVHYSCSYSPISEVCTDAFANILGYLSIMDLCRSQSVSTGFQTGIDIALSRLSDASFMEQNHSVKLDLEEKNQAILKVLTERCPRIRRLRSQTYVRLTREQCHALLKNCPRIQQITPSIEFQAADMVSVGMTFPDLTEARVHFSRVREGEAFCDICPSIRSLLIDSDNDQIGEVAAVLGRKLRKFKFLSIDLCARSVASAGIHKIPRHLTLALSVVGAIKLEHCQYLTRCKSNLVTLHLHHIPPSEFPIDGLQYLARHMKSLKELDMPHTEVSYVHNKNTEIPRVLCEPKAFPSLKRIYLKRYSSNAETILKRRKGHIKLRRRSCS